MRNLFSWIFASGISVNMHLIILIGFITLNCVGHAILLSGNLPCNFLDSYNITDGVFQSDRTIVYKDFKFPIDQYAKINYTFDNGMERTIVTPYTRGCICNRKPCIRLCCPYGSIQVKSKRCQPNEAANTINVYSEQYHSANVQNITPVRQFAFIHNYPCKRMRLINAEYMILAVCTFLFFEIKTNKPFSFSKTMRACE